MRRANDARVRSQEGRDGAERVPSLGGKRAEGREKREERGEKREEKKRGKEVQSAFAMHDSKSSGHVMHQNASIRSFVQPTARDTARHELSMSPPSCWAPNVEARRFFGVGLTARGRKERRERREERREKREERREKR